eukprot:CAMPEP_0113548616 /NCGR_PEP_ID=MMETSP0015_2-20120614/12988_1 /TAXON_ID=2838 /ORGANISM="Odontella" /LENGTH=622 /DNA_ID=CAMNT_0000449257 /DNA_START=64 /DNA_END=1932 /DNA_ORIENTATION=- /assembly_acc=CAM_ASM_000160
MTKEDGQRSQAAVPIILSLDELRVDLAPDIRRHLASQYESLVSRSPFSSAVSEGDDDDSVRESSSRPSSSAAERHLDRILDAMKRPPSATCCRVNIINSSVEEVRVRLDDALGPWRERRNAARRLRLLRAAAADDDSDGGRKRRRPEGSAGDEHDAEKEGEGRTGDEGEADDDVDDMIARPSGALPDVLLVGRSGARASTAGALRGPPPIASPNSSSGESSSPRAVFPNWEKRSERGWPSTHRALIVDRLCGEAVLRGSDVFVRGVLAADAGIAEGEDLAVYAHLDGGGEDEGDGGGGKKSAGSAKAFPRGLLLERYGGRCVFLGTGAARCGRADMFRLPRGLAVDMSSSSSAGAAAAVGPDLPPLNGVLESEMMLQNLPSAMVAHVLGPRSGEAILDMCSAPGGKACHVASLMRNEGLVVACDRSRGKVVLAREKFKTVGATCVVPLALNSTRCVVRDGSPWRSPKEIIESASATKKDGLLDVKAFHPESFDRILLDPPCSALGLRPKLRVDIKTLRDLSKHAEYQRRFASEAVALLKPGGTMTWSTCTIDASENEEMVGHVLREFPSMELAPIPFDLGRAGLPERGLSDAERCMVRRFDPCDDGDTMGFFVAKFVKKARS